MKLGKIITLSFALFMTTACTPTSAGGALCTVKFDTNTSLNASAVSTQTVKRGSRVKKPASQILGANEENYNVYAWYRDKNFSNEWNFKKDTVEKSMTLYARWERKYTVRYFVADSQYPVETFSVFNGSTVKEHPEYVTGYNYEGSFSDANFEHPFDYNAPITSNTDIYMKKSDGIDIYEGNPAGGLFDYLEVHGPTDLSGEVGNMTRVKDEYGDDAVLIDFGYSPTCADPFVELDLNLDITKSQILNFRMKHYGQGTTLTLYYTTLLDLDTSTYSATGKDYGPVFNSTYVYKPEEIGMSEEDDYIDVKIDLATPSNGLYHGYSVWGTSKYLGKLRIQSTYYSKSPTDRSNKILLKRIWGSNEGYENGVVTQDTANIRNILKDDTNIPDRPDLATGFVFPKDNEHLVSGETVDLYNKKQGLLVHFANEIEMRGHEDKTQTFGIDLPTNSNGDTIGDKLISLDTYKTIYIRLRNLGYVDNLKVNIRNDWEGTTVAELKVPTRMSDFKTFPINLSSDTSLRKTLQSITFEYVATGVDNAILIDSIYFDEAKPYDIPGISFDDKNCFGFQGSDVAVKYDQNYGSTSFNVSSSGAYVTSTKTNINLVNRGYHFAELSYTRPNNSKIQKVYISFSDGFGFGTEYAFETNQTRLTSVKVPLDVDATGKIKNVKVRFEGTGEIRFKALKFVLDDNYALNLANDFSNSFDNTWYNGISYDYDNVNSSSSLSVDSDVYLTSRRMSFYLGYGHAHYQGGYNCDNIYLAGKKKFVLVYRNVGENATGDILLGFASKTNDVSDGQNMDARYSNVTFKGNMQEYEWTYVEFDIPEKYGMKYLGKITFSSLTGTIDVRAFSVI